MRIERVGVSLLTFALAAVLTGHAIGASDDGKEKEEEETPATFSPEVEKKMAEFFDKATEAKRDVLEVRMRNEIEGLEKAAQLGAEERKSLDAAAVKAISVCLNDWTANISTGFREEYGGQGDQEINLFEQLLGQAEAYAKNDSWFADEAAQPEEHPIWTEAMRQALTAEQMTAAENARTERKRTIGKEIVELLKSSEAMARQQTGMVFAAWDSALKLRLTLSKEQTTQLDAIENAMTDEAAEAGRKQAEKWLLSADEATRRQMLKQRRVYFGTRAKAVKAQRSRWEQGVAKILSPDELQRFQTAQEEIKKQQCTALAQTMLSVLDTKLALSTRQRESLQPIAERVVRKAPSLFPSDEGANYWNFSPQVFLTVAAKAQVPDMQPILDAKQWERLQNAGGQRNSKARQAAADGTSAAKDDLPENPEPEDILRSVSDVLYEKTQTERERIFAENLLTVEDATRVAGLSPEVVRRLETAARGATEEMLVSWRNSMERNLGGQGQRPSPAAIKQLLVNLRNTEQDAQSEAVREPGANWKATVERELSPGQRTAWQKELDERAAYRDRAIISAVMAAFSRRNALTIAQWEKLEPLLAGVMKEYGAEITESFSNGWYLQHYTMMIPFIGIPEAGMKEILSKEQWENWAGSNEFSNGTNYWSNVQNQHTQRMKKKE